MATDRVHLLLYRTLLLGTAVAALAMGIAAGLDAPHITPEYQLTGYWRAYGLLVFAALAGYLGAAPPGAGVLWLVVLFHKASMTMTAVLLLRHDVTGAPVAAAIDGAIVLATLIALGLRIPAARAAAAAHEERANQLRTLAPKAEQARPLETEKSGSSLSSLSSRPLPQSQSPEALAPSPTPRPSLRPASRPTPSPAPGPAPRRAANSAPRQTARQTARQTGRQAARQTTRQTARQTSGVVDPNPDRRSDRHPHLHGLPA